MINKKAQLDYIDYETWILTFGGAFQRANVYKDKVSENEKKLFREFIRGLINNEISKKGYSERALSSEEHIKVLLKVKATIVKNHSNLLRNGQITLGVIQKLVNLNLKYKWCLGWIKPPPHCPFDRIIITRLGIRPMVSWISLNKTADYLKLVNKAAEKAGGYNKIAGWELNEFARR